ncbi:hypothetical protein GLW08_09125 [Pontibacillus yanchengensis]|uniref:DUF4190 domain-containing protein n=2 Tax=Pontibacillus yanchengensis TaxID=462910 RepID=A0A6I5A335_9BACI|nr:DUF4190 domain-containing protein [Pontibacillus yanchengensis]MYL33451.1 hypothetical protein [Pontibacillus yanchengensis]MYL53501.1 hypothetical protein [Pontibacillus yanchengensis]
MDDKNRNSNEEHVEEAPQYGNEKESEFKEIENHDQDERVIGEEDTLANSPSVYPGTDDVEFAQEAAIDENSVRDPIKSDEKETDMESNVQAGFGWLAVILSVLSFFILPVIMGAAGIIVGFIARRRGADTLGNTAIIAGAISIVLTLFLAPF